MRAEATPFAGVLFTGFMLTPAGPRVLEFNTRFGDPETEAILPRLKTDLLTLLEAAVDARLDQVSVELHPGACASVIAASAGYPATSSQGHASPASTASPTGWRSSTPEPALNGDDSSPPADASSPSPPRPTLSPPP